MRSALVRSLVPVVLLGFARAQDVLFFRQQNLAALGPVHSDVGSAIARLCAGPTPAEAAAGYTSHLPPGTQMLAWTQNGGCVRLVFDPTLLQLAAGCSREHAIEQIDKTALRAPGVDSVRSFVRLPDGSEVDLRTAFGEGTPLPLPYAKAPPIAGLTLPYGSLSGKRIA
ncbi:MAG: GerMN domain-containing protein, partial [Planctomycetes bacterium]|nr:GerMN domain-containing protein [Planctomycetota bacterium]